MTHEDTLFNRLMLCCDRIKREKDMLALQTRHIAANTHTILMLPISTARKQTLSRQHYKVVLGKRFAAALYKASRDVAQPPSQVRFQRQR